MLDRRLRADRLREFFSLQLTLADHIATRTGMPIGEAALTYTNLHRRFGLGDFTKLGVSPEWYRYTATLETLPPTRRSEYTHAFFLQSPDEPPPIGQHIFGCFSCEPPTEEGILRIHFINRDTDGVSPLDREKISLRRRELTELFTFAATNFPTAHTVLGTSWLYNLEAYRRLFPQEYTASSTPATKLRLSGMSSWGQFIRHNEEIRRPLRDSLLENLPTLDPAAPWRSFPLQALLVSAPFAVFLNFYSI